MKKTKEICKVNEVGMVTIPITIRESMNFSIKEKVEVYMENKNIIVRKFAENTDNTKGRTIDELSRIVIPIEYRNYLNINTDDEIEMFCKDNMIILNKREH